MTYDTQQFEHHSDFMGGPFASLAFSQTVMQVRQEHAKYMIALCFWLDGLGNFSIPWATEMEPLTGQIFSRSERGF